MGLEADGNLRLRVIDDADLPVDIRQGKYPKVLWENGTTGLNSHSWVMQPDGNLVVYNGLGATGTAVWSTNTWGHPGAFLRVQDDGNIVLVAPHGSGPNGTIWSTNTYAGPRP